MVDAVRPPSQQRSRASWNRVLTVGLELLEHGGYDALTISEVCRRAKVNAPSIYARVDGRDGLFRAVYDVGMRAVIQTEDELFAAADGTVEQAVAAAVDTFRAHEPLLRAVIQRASYDPGLLAAGGETSRRFMTRVAAAIDADPERARSAARMIYVECTFRAMYGDRFLLEGGESRDEFAARLATAAHRLLTGHDAPSRAPSS